MKIKQLCLLLSILFFGACNSESKLEQEIAKVEVEFVVERFEKMLYDLDVNKVTALKADFPFLFPETIQDSAWVNRIKDTLQQQILLEAKSNFNDFSKTEKDISNLFKHIKYYDKTFKLPRVITVADYVNYRKKVIVNDKLLIINLMNYLGKDHEFYQNISPYIAERMDEQQILPEITEEYAKRYAYQTSRRTFLDEIIYLGKLHYFKDVMLPDATDANKIGYSEQDVAWAKENEAQIWSYFVENEMLFSSDSKLFARFTAAAPFSKFYLEIDNQSPGRLGQYIGWQIVRAFAEKTDKDVLSVLTTESEEIFKIANYKPKR